MMELLRENPLVWLIGACEVGFWVLLGAGLAARYLMRARTLSTLLLLGVPVVDLVLVTASLLDVARGSRPGWTHGLAAIYLGFTVAFGHSIIRWADIRFAHRYAGGPAPVKPPEHGPARIAYEWREWGKAAAAWVIAFLVLAATAAVVGSSVPPVWEWTGDPLWTWAVRPGVVVLIWLVGWPLWVTLFPPKVPERADA